MKMIQLPILSLMYVGLLVGCKDNSKEVDALRKELADLKTKTDQSQEAQKLQREINLIREGELDGAIFIVTKARENVKMGLVTVSIFDASRSRSAVQMLRADLRMKSDEVTAQAKPLLADVERIRGEYNAAKEEYETIKKALDVAKREFVDHFNKLPGFFSKLGPFDDLANPKYDIRDGAENVQRKMAVHAEYFPTIKAGIDAKNMRGRKAEAELAKLNAAIEAFNAATKSQRDFVENYEQLCLAALGSPVSSVKTDADGKFKLMAPKSGEFVLGASASREVGRSSEAYLWIIAHSLDGKDRGQIFLSNDNQTDSYGTTSIVERFEIKAIPYVGREF